MIWRSIVRSRAIGSHRRLVATAVVYGLSLAVRFTSAAGEETEIPPQVALSANPMTSIMVNNGARTTSQNWPAPVQPSLQAMRVKSPWQCQ
ncbi:hypothetical protein [Bradyrhizobium sp. CCBAU 51753]|uniref:hypothetical protein n=1 Tax=Bradyrhizobium sp. CCBAU 51753 TaxID=1325100 RepID=UPI00188AD60F|nr:hypothetical protein [Bradyrhizobium sp. CCBAU 51753]